MSDGTIKLNLSAACGAWIDLDGSHAHRFCTGHVNLPPPLDVCECWCHVIRIDDGPERAA